MNASGVVAGVLNRTGSLGPEAGRRSRGELPRLALRHSTATEAARAIARLEGAAYRGFNLVVADRSSVMFLRGLGEGRIGIAALGPGLHMVTAADPDDASHPRVARHRPKFALAEPPEPPDWRSWPALLADSGGPLPAALNVPPTGDFGTASSALIAIGEPRQARLTGQFLFAAGPPHRAAFRPVPWAGGSALPCPGPEPSA